MYKTRHHYSHVIRGADVHRTDSLQRPGWPQGRHGDSPRVLVFTLSNDRPASYDTLRWSHNGRDGVSNHQPRHCLLSLLFRRRSKKTSKPRVTGLCAGNSPGPVNSPYKWPVTRKMFPFDDVIVILSRLWYFDGNDLYNNFGSQTSILASSNVDKIQTSPSRLICQTRILFSN